MLHLFLSMLVCLLVICSRHCLWLRAASPELQEEEQAATKPPRPARQAIKLSKKRRPARLDVASSMQQSLHGLQSETQLSICAHFTNLIATTQNTASLTYNRQTKGQIYEAALGRKAKYGVLHDAVLYSTAKIVIFDVLLLPFADKPNTELPKAEIMSLLKDPSSLVQVRDSISTLQGNKHIRNSFHVVSTNFAWLRKPGCCCKFPVLV